MFERDDYGELLSRKKLISQMEIMAKNDEYLSSLPKEKKKNYANAYKRKLLELIQEVSIYANETVGQNLLYSNPKLVEEKQKLIQDNCINIASAVQSYDIDIVDEVLENINREFVAIWYKYNYAS